jgi:hypothetical protein
VAYPCGSGVGPAGAAAAAFVAAGALVMAIPAIPLVLCAYKLVQLKAPTNASAAIEEVISFFIINLGRSEGFNLLNGSKGFIAFLLRANPKGIVDGGDENLAITDLSGLGRLDDCPRGRVYAVVGEHNLQFDFRQEIHGVFTAAVNFGVAFLPTESLDLGDGHAFDAYLTECIFDLLELEWFYDCFDFLHSFCCAAIAQLGLV